MTSQCASGSGQFLENIARYLGVSHDEIGAAVAAGDEAGEGELDLRGARRDRRDQHGVARASPRRTSCAASTRAWPSGSCGCCGRSTFDGAGVRERRAGVGHRHARRAARRARQEGGTRRSVEVVTHESAIFAGSIGAALWGAFRYRKMSQRGVAWTAASRWRDARPPSRPLSAAMAMPDFTYQRPAQPGRGLRAGQPARRRRGVHRRRHGADSRLPPRARDRRGT